MSSSSRSANRAGICLVAWQRRAIYVIAVGIWLSGTAWLLLHYFAQAAGEFGSQAHPLERPLLLAHGAFAFLSVWGLGLVWMPHVRNAWRARRNRVSGTLVVALVIVLTLTGWGLYYLGGERVRAVTSVLHWLIGLSGLALLPVHIWLGRRSRAPRPFPVAIAPCTTTQRLDYVETPARPGVG